MLVEFEAVVAPRGVSSPASSATRKADGFHTRGPGNPARRRLRHAQRHRQIGTERGRKVEDEPCLILCDVGASADPWATPGSFPRYANSLMASSSIGRGMNPASVAFLIARV